MENKIIINSKKCHDCGKILTQKNTEQIGLGKYVMCKQCSADNTWANGIVFKIMKNFLHK